MTIEVYLQNHRLIEGNYIIFQQDVTEDEFWSFATEDIKCELLDGVLVIHSPANTEHEEIFSHLLTIWKLYLDSTRKGKVLGSRLVMRLSKKWNPEPDLLIITPEKYANLGEGRLNGPADLVIEILSKSTREVDLQKKLPEYLKAGVKEIWIIDPMERSVTVYAKDLATRYTDPDSDDVIQSNLFLDLKIRTKWIWNRKTYTVPKIMKEIPGL